MKIALIGASGQAGSRILDELVRRGFSVTAIARNIEKIKAGHGVSPVKADVFDKAGLVDVLRGHDVLISAVHFSASDADLLIAAAHESGVGRYLVVGGAGSLLAPDGSRVVDSPSFPGIYKTEALKGAEFLEKLRAQSAVNWTFLSPSAFFIAGERTGTFRLGRDHLLADSTGKSWISFEDFAIALVDEIEKPAHKNQRFTVGY